MDYQIIIPVGANAIEKEAALALQKYLSKLSVKSVSVQKVNRFLERMFLGETEYAKARQMNSSKIPEAGFICKTEGENFIIAGGAKEVYFLEFLICLEGLGFRKYSPEIAGNPRLKALNPPKAEKLVEPKIRYRTTSLQPDG